MKFLENVGNSFLMQFFDSHDQISHKCITYAYLENDDKIFCLNLNAFDDEHVHKLCCLCHSDIFGQNPKSNCSH